MPKVLAYEDAEGTKLVVPVIQPGMTEAQSLELAALLLNQSAVAVDLKNVPALRDFREAWKLDGTKVVEDLALAKEISMARCRAQRNTKLAASDSERLRLDETGTAQQQAALRVKRQALRDLPAQVQLQVDAAKTVDALRSVDLTGGL